MSAPSRVQTLLAKLHKLALPIVTAESCTSGLLASTLTSKPAAPSVLLGGVTSYSPLFKHKTLGVPARVLDTSQGGPGDVSRECALAMARGVLNHSGLLDPSDTRQFKFGVLKERGQGIGVSTTGFLDGIPEGEDERRVGEVWVGVAWVFKGKEGQRVETFNVAHKEGEARPEAPHQMDENDARREARKNEVVKKAVDIVMDVVEELEKGAKAEEQK
jgi:nicotinamide mononucleotide (NMN) deamidase PncC